MNVYNQKDRSTHYSQSNYAKGGILLKRGNVNAKIIKSKTKNPASYADTTHRNR